MSKGRRNGPRPGDDVLNVLRRTMSPPAIEGLSRDVIERLSRREPSKWKAPRSEIRALCHALCAPYPHSAQRFVDRLLAAGVPVQRVYEDYLTEAARTLGRRWDQNAMSFGDVSRGVARIFVILHELRDQRSAVLSNRPMRLAFAAVPGEQHTLGVEMAADLFRREGWDVSHFVGMSHDELVDAMEDVDIVLLGLSASGSRRRAALLKLLVALRLIRPDLKILLSGAIAQTERASLGEFGVDAVVSDIPTALMVVQGLLSTAPEAAKSNGNGAQAAAVEPETGTAPATPGSVERTDEDRPAPT